MTASAGVPPEARPVSLAGEARRGPGWRWVPLLALVVVGVTVLAIGSHRTSHPTLAQETTSIASAVRCPVCSGETAAQSQTTDAQNIRRTIKADLEAGRTRQQILAQLVAAYGISELERPPVRGFNLILWLLPGVVVAAAVAGLVVVFRHWRVARARAVSEADRRLVGEALARHPNEQERR
ncbi:MAG TPA: cytochrome c-type biogenesis protein CcmH [Acidimicrobiales bacterium]|nr:cytochrome c-type biogenesis protein CcmH [Acidimicrobiales bacterium]